jgi:predicted lipoprotein with Yx(FWY)xxD motif
MLRTRIAVSVAAAAAGLAVLTACSGAETAQPVIAPAAAGGTGGGQIAGGQVGNAAPASNESKLVVADVASVGQVLTDQNGMTLYRFDKDTAKPPKSNCDGDCAKAWPPMLATGDVQVQGVDKNLVGKVTRSDGTEQITVGGWALYRYAKDTKAGDATGQGVGGAWYASNAKGGKAGQAASEAGAGAVKLSASNIDGLGAAIVDQNGMTLYLFQKDTKKAKTSACNGDCAKTWPPVLSNGKVELQGINSKLLGSIKRSDGTEQVTIGGWPVYTFSKDTKPGDANGNGVNGTWFVIEPAGCKIGTGPSATANQAPAPADSGAGSSNSGAGGTTY